MMNEPSSRRFKLDLTIPEEMELSGAHAMIALLEAEDGVPVIKVVAGGFPATDEGAGELSDMLRDTADAIDEHLGKPRPHLDTADMRQVHIRPRFNPQPRGPQQ
jgi:hypothetical protein